MQRTFPISVIVMLAAFLAGCAATPTYQSSATEPGQAAILRAWSSGKWAFFTYTQIEKVDGRHLSIYTQTWPGSMVDPGVRVLSVAGTYAGMFGERDTARVELAATLKAGHIYLLKAERSDHLMTLWLEDEDTHELASEKKTSGTTRWIQWL
ncbi:MAG: hypothetical protein NHG36_11430 [Chromatiaceae bacterium]|nr:hypothetical protein [Candidatus Thioaporhodococcus sediminis]